MRLRRSLGQPEFPPCERAHTASKIFMLRTAGGSPRCSDAELQIGSSGAAQGEAGPYIAQRGHQRLDVGLAVERARGEAQALGAARHGRVVDRLDVDAMAGE